MQTSTYTNPFRLLLGAAGGLLLVVSSSLAQAPGPETTPQETPAKETGSTESQLTESQLEGTEQKQSESKETESKPVEEPKIMHFPPMEEVINGHGQGAEDPQERIRQLFGEVETHLRDVDRLLGDAAAGDTNRLSEATEAGIGKLLQDSLKRGREAQAKIAEIVELAKAASASQSGSGDSNSKGDPSSGEGDGKGSPLDRGEQRQSQEQTPEMGGGKPQGQQEGEGQDGEKPGDKPGDKPEGEQPGGSEPKSPGGDDSAGENRTGNDPAEGAAEKARQAAQARDGWGDLPTHVKDTFRSQGRSELPVRYRDWIDEYYRKLNRKGDR